MPKQMSIDRELFLKKMKTIFSSIFSEVSVSESILPLFVALFLENSFESQVLRILTPSLRKTLPKEFQDYSKSVKKILTEVYPKNQKEQTKEICAKASKRIMKLDELNLNTTQLLFLKHFFKEILTALRQIKNEKDTSVLITLMRQVLKIFGESEQNRSLLNAIQIVLRTLKAINVIKDISPECRQFLGSFQDKLLEAVLPFDKLTRLSIPLKIALSGAILKSDDFSSYYFTVILQLANDNGPYDIEKLNQVVSNQISFLRVEITNPEKKEEIFQIYAARLQMIQTLLHQFLELNSDIFNGEASALSLRETIRNFNKLLHTFRDNKYCEEALYFNPVIYADSDLLAMPESDKALFATIKKEYKEQCKQFQPALYNAKAKALPLTPITAKEATPKKSMKAKVEQITQLVENPAEIAKANFIADVLEPDTIEKKPMPLEDIEVNTEIAQQQLKAILDGLVSFDANLAASLMNSSYSDPFVYVKAEFLIIYNRFFPIAHVLRNNAPAKELLTHCFSNLMIIRYKLLSKREDDILEQLNLPSDCDTAYDYSEQQPINFTTPLKLAESETGSDNLGDYKKKSSSNVKFRQLKKLSASQQAQIPLTAPKTVQAFFSPLKSNVPSAAADQKLATKQSFKNH